MNTNYCGRSGWCGFWLALLLLASGFGAAARLQAQEAEAAPEPTAQAAEQPAAAAPAEQPTPAAPTDPPAAPATDPAKPEPAVPDSAAPEPAAKEAEPAAKEADPATKEAAEPAAKEAPPASEAEKAPAEAAQPEAEKPAAETSEAAKSEAETPAAKTEPATGEPETATAKKKEEGPVNPLGETPGASKKPAAAAVDTKLVERMPWYKMVGIAALSLLLIIGPFIWGNWIAGKIRMPDHGWKIGLIAGTLLWAAVITYGGWPPKLGPDLSGGINLIYEVDPHAEKKSDFSIQQMINALTLRVNPGGVKEVMIRPYGQNQVEIIIPLAGESEVDYIKRQISTAGSLQFRITANHKNFAELIKLAYETEGNDIIDADELIGHWSLIDLKRFDLVANSNSKNRGEQSIIATAMQTSGNVVGDRNQPSGYWLELDSSFIPEEQQASAVVRQTPQGTTEVLLLSQSNQENGGYVMRADPQGRPQVLMAHDEFNVTGDMLDAAASSTNNQGQLVVLFTFKARGAQQFSRLTTKFQPDNLGFHSQLGILLDDTLLSAPRLNEPITGGRGEISGNFTKPEIDFLVSILNAGSLPAALNKVPIREETTSPELGSDTVYKGALSMAISLASVFLFALVYYRFSGILACFALASNILLTLAIMIAIKAAFTLPGLAGMVLTVGMAVDANVLIFERMREEISRGTALRMAIRNGFERATTAIVDSNLTTLITAVVLYWIGTDQIKGFAVTLILGIVMSMFTAIFCTRAIFEIAERRRWVTDLRMMKLLTTSHIDFLGKRYVAIGGSLVLIAIGIVALIGRGKNILDIDFVGGSSVTVQFQQPQDIADVRKQVETAVRKLETTVEGFKKEAETARPKIEAEIKQRLEADPVYKEKTPEEQADFLADEVRTAVSTRYPEADVVIPVDVSVVGIGDKGDEYKIDTSILDFNLAQRLLSEEFGDKLLRNSLDFKLGTATGPAPPAEATPKPEPKVGSTPLPGEDEVAFADDAQAALLAQNADTASDTAPADAPGTKTAETPTTEKAETEKAETEKPASTEANPAKEPVAQEPAAAPESTPAPANTNKESATEAPATGSPAAESTPEKAAPEAPGVSATPAAGPDSDVGAVTKATLTFGQAINHDAVTALIQQSMETPEIPHASFQVTSRDPRYTSGSVLRLTSWNLSVGLNAATTEKMLTAITQQVIADPVFPSSSNIGGKVAGDTQMLAAYAMLVSLVAIVAYIWFRFSSLMYGVAAVIALVHDVLITIGLIALSSFVIQYLPFVATPLLLDPFKISLPIVAALLTLVGYSLNDTIVIFDRIREVKGKSPNLTVAMLNQSLNQTLSRTILTSLTTFMVVVILYFLGGPGIHGFAFALSVGIVTGTYSSIFIACPVLDWLSNPASQTDQPAAKAVQVSR